MEIKGKCFGIRIIERTKTGEAPNDALQLLVEDDDNWFDKSEPFDAAWADEIIKLLQLAKAAAVIGVPIPGEATDREARDR